jgi:hypothetical protein
LHGHNQTPMILRERSRGNQRQECTTKEQPTSHLCLRGASLPPSLDGEMTRRLGLSAAEDAEERLPSSKGNNGRFLIPEPF